MRKRDLAKRDLAMVGVVLGALGVAWVLVSLLPLAALRVLLILIVLGQPVVFWVGWSLGARDARTYVAGVDKGAGSVINAGGRVADLRASKIQEARRAGMPDVRLPDATRLEIVGGEEGRLVEL